jgi:redox-sensing transcriptional repressor
MKLSNATIYRLCGILKVSQDALANGKEYLPSNKLGQVLEESADTIRKDVTKLQNIESGKSGYKLKTLIDGIKSCLNLQHRKSCCVVGLGNIGSGILNYKGFFEHGYDIVAGFDASNNKIEMLDTDIELYPMYEIEDVVKAKGIELGIIAVPEAYAQEIADMLINGGVKGIVNFAPVVIKTNSANIHVRNIDLTTELNFLSALNV